MCFPGGGGGEGGVGISIQKQTSPDFRFPEVSISGKMKYPQAD